MNSSYAMPSHARPSNNMRMTENSVNKIHPAFSHSVNKIYNLV